MHVLCLCHSDGVIDEESPLGGHGEDKTQGYMDEGLEDKEFEESSMMMPPGSELCVCVKLILAIACCLLCLHIPNQKY